MNGVALAIWLERLESRHPKKIDLGLQRVAAVANQLQLLPVQVPVVTVAGTNGKGTTAAVLEAVLLATGRRPGVCCSPHLLRFNERIRVAGQLAPDEEIVRAFEHIEVARGDISLSYFEFATLAALLIFSWQAIDVAILEVGLGGRLDAVNIVDPSVAIITSIALDHQDWLGATRGLIAREKAGILRAGVPAVIAEPDPPAELSAAITAIGAQGYFLGNDFHCESTDGGWRGRLYQHPGLQRELPEVPAGPLVPTNIAAALQALLLLGESFSDAQLMAALPNVFAPGRRQLLVVSGREYVFDVAHNPASVDRMHEFLTLNPCNGKTMSLFSAMADKDIEEMVRILGNSFDVWYLADQPDNPRAAPAAVTAAILRRQGHEEIDISKRLRQAFNRARSAMAAGDRLVVFGSFFTVGEILPLLDETVETLYT